MVDSRPAVVYIITKLELGGAQKVCLALKRDAIKHGYRTYLISGAEGTLVADAQQLPDTFLLSLLTREVRIFGWWREIKTFFTIINLLRNIKKDHATVIVHTHSTKAGLIGRWAAWFARIPHRIHTVHGFGFHAYQTWLVWLPIFMCEWITAWITTHWVCVSQTNIAEGSQLLPRFAERASLIRAAVEMPSNISLIPLRVNTEDPFIFGTISCFKPQKNLIDIILAFKSVHKLLPLTRLAIIGDGIQRKELEQLIAEHKLTQVVTLHGWQQDILPFLRRWDAYVMSSLWEGLPCAVIEARLAHLPVISYRTGGIPEVIVHEKNGLLCDEKNWQSLAQHMYTVAKLPNVHWELAKYTEDLSDFTYDAMARKHVELYNTLNKSSRYARKSESAHGE